MRRCLFPAILAALVFAGAASADGPVITDVQDRIVRANGFPECGFAIALDVQRDVRFIRFFDASGRLVREIRHIHFEGTLTANGKTLSYEGRWTRTLDTGAGTLTLTGLRFKAEIPELGISLTTGREVVDAQTVERLEQSGHPPEEFVADMCTYLAP